MSGKHDVAVERAHFDEMAATKGRVWWGTTTRAGQRRMEMRAEIVQDALAHYLNPVVLEVGCGAAAFTRYVLNLMPSLRLVGGDISEECLKIARVECARFAHAQFVLASVDEMAADPAHRGRYDAVIGNAILHHLDEEKALGQIYELLKPGGLFLFFEPNMLNPHVAVVKNIPPIKRWAGDTPDETAYVRWRIEALLRRAGYIEVEVKNFDFLYPLVPASLIGIAEVLSNWLETAPVLKEISGSLILSARK